MSLPFELYKGHKHYTLKNWKRYNIKNEDIDSIYNKYIHCEFCEKCDYKFKKSSERCLDHCHLSGNVRNIVCRSCNSNMRFQSFKNSTGHQYISKVKNNDCYIFSIRIRRRKKDILTTARKTLEDAIKVRDDFIKNNPKEFE